MKWRDLPNFPTSNVEEAQPLSWVERDVFEDNPQFTAPQQYNNLRYIYLDQHPLTPEQQAWTSTNMPDPLPTTPLADPDAAPDPSILARQRMPPTSGREPWFGFQSGGGVTDLGSPDNFEVSPVEGNPFAESPDNYDVQAVDHDPFVGAGENPAPPQQGFSGHVWATPEPGQPVSPRYLSEHAPSLTQGEPEPGRWLGEKVYGWGQSLGATPEHAQGLGNLAQFGYGFTPPGSAESAWSSARQGDFPGTVFGIAGALPIPGAAPERGIARVLSPLGFYSHGADVAANLPQAKGTVQQVVSALRKAGVKPEEMQRSGVGDIPTSYGPLFEHAGFGQPKIERQAVVDMFQRGQPPLQETMFQRPDMRALNDASVNAERRWNIERQRGVQDARELRAWTEYTDAVDRANRAQLLELPKYEKYVEPGGDKNYREIVMHLPPGEGGTMPIGPAEYWERMGGRGRWEDLTEGQQQNVMAEWPRTLQGYRDPDFQSSHWDQPNVVAHLRLNDRTGSQGEKLLHMEELQSDWGQAVRKAQKVDPNAPRGWESTEVTAVPDAAPYIGTTQGWTDLGLKRALIEAARGDYTHLSWTHGELQSRRWPGREAGLTGYYDNIVPTQLSKLAKKLDPNAKMGTVNSGGGRWYVHDLRTNEPFSLHEFDTPEMADMFAGMNSHTSVQQQYLRARQTPGRTFPALEITPLMRERILQGLPAYAYGGRVGYQDGGAPATPNELGHFRAIGDISPEADIPPEQAYPPSPLHSPGWDAMSPTARMGLGFAKSVVGMPGMVADYARSAGLGLMRDIQGMVDPIYGRGTVSDPATQEHVLNVARDVTMLPGMVAEAPEDALTAGGARRVRRAAPSRPTETTTYEPEGPGTTPLTDEPMASAAERAHNRPPALLPASTKDVTGWARAGQPEIVWNPITRAWDRTGGRTTAFDPNLTLFSREGAAQVPNVSQIDLSRYNPPRGVPQRTLDITSNPEVRAQHLALIRRGLAMSGAAWYQTAPLRDAFIQELGPEQGAASFRNFMDMVAAASPQQKVPENIRTASYYYWLNQNRLPVPERGDKPRIAYGGGQPVSAPYGGLALWQMNVNRVMNEGGFDPHENPKPPSFSQNLQGNWAPATVDMHATLLPAMLARHPDWLTPEGKALYQSGTSMDELVQNPSLWDSSPKKNEYPTLERYYKSLADELGITPAQVQAASWVGGGHITGLGSDAQKDFMKFVEDRIANTAAKTGQTPQEALRGFIRGRHPLLSIGPFAAMPPAVAVYSRLRQQERDRQPEYH